MVQVRTIGLVLGAMMSATLALTLPETQATPNLQRAAVEQKLRLLDWLLNESDVASTVASHSADQARVSLQRARDMHRRALEHLALGDLQAALESADAGLEQVTAASRLVTDPNRRQRLASERYEELRQRISLFRQLLQDVAEGKAVPVGDLLDPDRYDELLRQTAELAAREEYAGANSLLSTVAELTERALSQARHKETLVYRLEFDTPEEEFLYELERHRSYELMVEHFVPDINDGPSSTGLRERAESAAARGDYDKVLSHLDAANEALARMLRRGGVFLPR